MRKKLILSVFAICLIALLTLCITGCNKPVKSTDIPDTDTIEQYVPTVQEVLQEREDIRYAHFCDSVYLCIPEQVLTQILVTKGTTISIQEVVETYITNKDFYGYIKKAMDIQKEYLPDSMPKASIPQPNSDTVHAAVYLKTHH